MAIAMRKAKTADEFVQQGGALRNELVEKAYRQQMSLVLPVDLIKKIDNRRKEEEHIPSRNQMIIMLLKKSLE